MTDLAITGVNLSAISPLLSLALAGFVIIGLGLWASRMSAYFTLATALLGLVAAGLFSIGLWNENESAFGGMFVCDNYGLAFSLIFLLCAVLSILLAFNQHEKRYLLYPEFSSVLLFATLGMILMASTTNLLMIFLGLETLSISLYVLAGIKRTESRSLEAAFKYFLLGAFASAFLLYGITLLYGAAGSLELTRITHTLTDMPGAKRALIAFGGLLIFIGLGFKVALFPFQMWAPDVYQGAPTPISAFMSTGSKAAGFAAMLRVLYAATPGLGSDLEWVFWILAVATMFFGNIAAIVQKNVKRMLAYSSIAHAGYIMIGIVAWNETGAASVIFYLLSYTFINIGAFGVIAYLGSDDREFQEIQDLRGLGFRQPLIALVMSIFMFSLAGLPPTAGFVGKFYLFSAAVKAGHIPLVILGVINSMISLYYYLGIVVTMFMREAEKPQPYNESAPAVAVSLTISTVGALGIGLFPSFFMSTFQNLVSLFL